MKNQSKLTAQFFVSLIFLFSGLMNFVVALSKNGLENNFVADNWGIPVALLLAIVFGLGWLWANMIERMVLSGRRKAAAVAFFVFLLIFVLLVLGSSFVFTPLGFLQFAMRANGLFLTSGFLLRFSVSAVDPIVLGKPREHNQ